MSNHSLLNVIRHQLQPRHLAPNLLAGMVIGLIAVAFALSFSFLLLPGELSAYLPQYFGYALFSSTVIQSVIAVKSSGTVSGCVQDAPAAICGLNAVAISTALPANIDTQTKFIVLLAVQGFTTIIVGLCCWLLGKLNLGSLIRFIPHPVVGGFLAGTGWLLFSGSFNISANLALSLNHLSVLFQVDQLVLWGPGLIYAVFMFFIARRWKTWFLLPTSILIAISLFYIFLGLTQTSIGAATQQGWLIAVPESAISWHPLPPSSLIQVDWALILPQLGGILTVLLLTAIAVLMTSSGLEVATQQDIELNQELKAVGIANVLSGLGSGMVGYHGVSLTLLIHKMGATGRLTPLVASLISLLALISGPEVIGLMPKFVLSGLAAWLGLSLLAEWLYDGWFKLSRSDYLNVIVILAIIVFVGFLQGIAYGIMVAVILFAINYTRTPMARYTLTGKSYTSRVRRLTSQEKVLHRKGEQIHILQLQGLLFFGTASRLLDNVQVRLQDNSQPSLKFVILDFRLVTGLDSSVITIFLKLKQLAVKSNFSLVLTSLSPRIEQRLQLGEVLVEPDPIFHVFPDLDQGMAWCEEQLLKLTQMRRSRSTPLFVQLKASFPKPELVTTLMHSYLIPMELMTGETLFQQGAVYDGLYFLEAGQISLIDTHQDEHRDRVMTYQRGTLIGERGLYRESTYSFTAVADCKSRLFFLPADALVRMEQKHPQLASALHRFTIRSLVEQLDYRDKEIQMLLK